VNERDSIKGRKWKTVNIREHIDMQDTKMWRRRTVT